MASKKKRVTTKSKRKNTPLQAAQKVMVSPKKKSTSKKRTIKRTPRERVSQRKPTRSRRPACVVKYIIVDQIDDPLPAVTRFIEIAEVRVVVLDERAAKRIKSRAPRV